jgi:hypothetical protein
MKVLQATMDKVQEDRLQVSFGLSEFNGFIVGAFAAKKNAKLKYVYEERVDNDKEPSKFYGYQDDAFNAGSSGGANYAIMIYDVRHQAFINDRLSRTSSR